MKSTPTEVPERTRIECPPSILAKVSQFHEQAEVYQSGEYSEAQLRIDFLNPMLEALGWDVNNRQGHAEAYREVVYEDALKVGGASKAPDYGFYVGGRAAGGGRKFFLEAKRPSVAISVRAEPAFQLRRYAYSAELPLSILTNFKQFIAYDTRIKPSARDSATAAAIVTIHYTEYPQRWDEIASVFSRDAILRGAFDKFAQGKRKRGAEPLGEAFLKDVEGWREVLAREIAANNDLAVEDLNFAVQRTIDRILFLRICEDRGIEPVGNLMQLLNGEKVYERLGAIFRAADDRYNSGIFHFPTRGRKPDLDRTEPPDDLTLDLRIGDATLRPIIRGLYDAPGLFTSYAFAVIPPEILGQVYERFLGKVITIPSEHKVKIEEKPEVRKAGGVYYTPAYIVDYIVRNTVGKLLEGKSPKEAAKLRILDPASGSGSFLIVAYQFLLDWHLRWYLANDPDAHCKGKNPSLMRIAAPSFAAEDGGAELTRSGPRDYRLTTQKRKEVLLNSIYGVDIDAQAVEVTKLSLLLKVLEGESQESVNAQLRFLHQRALPDLGKNIKWGNSLIGDDFDGSDLVEEERRKINEFDWQREFPHVFKSGGFDAVIGNPPYVLLQSLDVRPVFQYLADSYDSAKYKIDTYQLFIERAVELTATGGRIGYITPNTFLRNKHALELRRLLLANTQIELLVLFDFNVFDGPSVDTAILIAQRSARPAKQHQVQMLRSASAGRIVSIGDTLQFAWATRADLNFDLPRDRSDDGIIERIRGCSVPLGSFATAYFGIQTLSRRKYVKPTQENKLWRPALDGGNIDRYSLRPPVEWVNTDSNAIKSGGKRAVYEQARIGVRQIGRRPIASLLPAGWYSLNTIYNVLFTKQVALDLKYVLGLLSSNLLGWYWEQLYFDQKRTFPKVKKGPLLSLPIRAINFSKTSEKSSHDRMVKLVDHMLHLHNEVPKAKSPHAKERLQRDIDSTDRQIDALVYELYGLTADEVRIVEGAAP